MTTTTASQHPLRRVFIEKVAGIRKDGTIRLEVLAPERDHLLLSRDLARKRKEPTG